MRLVAPVFGGRLLTRAPTRRAFVIAIDSDIICQYACANGLLGIIPSIPAVSLSISARIEFRDTSFMFDPTLLITSYSARSIAFWTPVSDVLDPVTSSEYNQYLHEKSTEGNLPAINGSIRGVSVIRVPSAFAALDRRTSLEVSAKDLANVRWSCGRKGFRRVGIFSKRLFRVSKIAATYC